MADVDWPFDQPRNCAVIALRSIVFQGAPILHVAHDEDDHGWQFLSSEDADVSQGAVVCLAEIVTLDPTVLELADLPPGWHAWRESKSSPWKREQRPGDGTMWTPINLESLYDRINRGDAAMDTPTRRLWNAIRVEPQKWQLHPWGDMGGGFWVVGVIGRYAVWFNDIEDGFNLSRYETAGVLLEYCCNQDELNQALCAVQHMIEDGYVQGRFGPPQPISTNTFPSPPP